MTQYQLDYFQLLLDFNNALELLQVLISSTDICLKYGILKRSSKYTPKLYLK